MEKVLKKKHYKKYIALFSVNNRKYSEKLPLSIILYPYLKQSCRCHLHEVPDAVDRYWGQPRHWRYTSPERVLVT